LNKILKINYKKHNCFLKINLYLVLIFIFLASIIFINLDKKIFENAVIQAEFDINNQINFAINNAVDNLTKKNNLAAKDFYNISLDDTGKINFLSANTVLINKFCSELAVLIPKEFAKPEANIIKISFGSIISSLTGTFLFNSIGPNIKLRIIPIGNAFVDFESKFMSAGVNQTNFAIWLNIKFNSKIINPVQHKDIIFNKKLALVNTVINGSVPNAFFK